MGLLKGSGVIASRSPLWGHLWGHLFVPALQVSESTFLSIPERSR
jgi:hypothetical protein